VIRDRCGYRWNEGEAERFLEKVPVLADTFALNFELKEKDFDGAGIPVNNDDKDHLAVHRRRALLLHAAHVLSDLKKQAGKKSK
jgi:hypothetical protein